MTSNGPQWPDPGQDQGYTPPTPAPGTWAPPSEPEHYEPATQAVPNYAPPATADHQIDPYLQGGNAGSPTPTPNRPSGQRALLAGVLGGLVTLGVVMGAFLFFSSNDEPDEPEPEPQTLVDPNPTEEDEPAEPTTPDPDARIGTSVTGLELLAGDCINYDASAIDIETFDVVTCGTPHLAEIAAQLPHPDAGGSYPGVEELHSWSGTPCRDASSDYLGTDVLATTFTSTTLVPDAGEWSDGLTSVGCLIQAADGARIIESIEGRGSSYARETETAINRLRPGDCFLPIAPQAAFDLGADDIVSLAACGSDHDGLFFGRGVLTGATSTAYPGEEAVDQESIEICDAAFVGFFAVPSDGLNYRYWTPNQSQWDGGERAVECALLDEAGLPPTPDYGAFEVMFDLPIGQCFEFGPEETVDLLRLDDRVKPVDCTQPHNGEVFGLGELAATTDPFPGDEVADEQIKQTCIDVFTGYVGISPFESNNGDFRYWFPSQTGWEAGDLRWACALVTDDTRTGSIEGANS
ncbi:MAG: septum formation family protein [Acidimicrobiales bacterium]